MRGLRDALRAPRIIVLENVVGWLTSQNGKDFASVVEALSEMGYRSGAVVIDAAHFVPQSRERVFLVAVREDIALPPALCADGPQEGWHPASMVRAVAGEPSWAWWRAPTPAQRNSVFADLVEEQPSGVAWDLPTKTAHILGLMTPVHRQKVDEAMRSGRRAVGTLYRRTRPNGEGGAK